MNKLPITATMVVYNEGTVLERAIKSFYDLVDEIIIVHDGECKDKSLEIAKKYTDKVFVKPHIGGAEPHRVFEFIRARNDWILMLDPDDILTDELRTNLPRLVRRKTDIYEFASPYWYHNKFHFGAYRICLFKKSKSYYIGSVHEYIKPLNKKVVVERVNFGLVNKPDYENFSLKVFKSKWIPRARVQAKQLAGNFKDIPKLNYKRNQWDYPNNLRVRYPIIFGILGSSVYSLYNGVKDSCFKRDLFFLRLGLFMSFYYVFLYYYVYVHKNFK